MKKRYTEEQIIGFLGEADAAKLPILARGTIVEGRDPRGYRYFWFGLDQIEHTLDHGTDLEAIEEGYVAVTPLQLDLTHYSTIGILAERFTD